MAAEREANDRYLAEYLADREGAEFDARIRGVTRFGLFVMLDETGADGFVPMRHIGSERFHFEEAEHAVIGERTGGVYRLGQEVRVRLAEATPLTGGLRFDMLSDPQPAEKKTRSGRGGPAKKRTTKRTAKTGSKSSRKPAKKKLGKKKPRKSNAKPRSV